MMKECVTSVRLFNQKAFALLFVEVKIFVTFCFSKNESIVRLKGVREDEEKRFKSLVDVVPRVVRVVGFGRDRTRFHRHSYENKNG